MQAQFKFPIFFLHYFHMKYPILIRSSDQGTGRNTFSVSNYGFTSSETAERRWFCHNTKG